MSKRPRAPLEPKEDDQDDRKLNPVILEKSIDELLSNTRPEEVLMKVNQLVAMKAAHLVKKIDSFPQGFNTPNPFLSLSFKYPRLTVCFQDAWDNTIGLARLKTLQPPVEQDGFQLDIKKANSEDRKKLTIFSQTVTRLVSNPFFTNADEIDKLSLAKFLISSQGSPQILSGDSRTKFTYLILKKRVTYIISNLNVLIHLCNPKPDSSHQLQSTSFFSKTPQLAHSALGQRLVDRILPIQHQTANGYAVLKLLPHTGMLEIPRYQIYAYNELIDAILEFRYLSDVEKSSVQFHKLQSLFVELQKKIIDILTNVAGFGKITFPSDLMHQICAKNNYYKYFSMIRLISNNIVSKTLILFLCKSVFTLLTDSDVERVSKFICFLTRERNDEMEAGMIVLLQDDGRALYRLLTFQFGIPAKNVNDLVKIILPKEGLSEDDSSGEEDSSDSSDEVSSGGRRGGRSNKSKKVRRYKKKINTKRVKRHMFRRGRSQCNKKK